MQGRSGDDVGGPAMYVCAIWERPAVYSAEAGSRGAERLDRSDVWVLGLVGEMESGTSSILRGSRFHIPRGKNVLKFIVFETFDVPEESDGLG